MSRGLGRWQRILIYLLGGYDYAPVINAVQHVTQRAARRLAESGRARSTYWWRCTACSQLVFDPPVSVPLRGARYPRTRDDERSDGEDGDANEDAALDKCCLLRKSLAGDVYWSDLYGLVELAKALESVEKEAAQRERVTRCNATLRNAVKRRRAGGGG